MEKILDFTSNWNGGKLDNDTFTSFRLSGRFQIGDILTCNLIKGKKTECKGLVRVIGKQPLSNIEEITDWMSYLDIGYDAEKFKNIIKLIYPSISNWNSQPIYYYLFQKVKPAIKT